MMNGYGGGGEWLGMIVVWVALIGVVVFAIARLITGGRDSAPGDEAGRSQPTARQILDRRLALGEIDPETHNAITDRLAHRERR
jgi:putative membrane protein